MSSLPIITFLLTMSIIICCSLVWFFIFSQSSFFVTTFAAATSIGQAKLSLLGTKTTNSLGRRRGPS
jgi:hypothetical protein